MKRFVPGAGAVAFILCLCISPAPALSEHIFYCSDTATTGFKWEKTEEARLAGFRLSRFTIKIESENERQILQTSEGENAGIHQYYTCAKRLGSKVVCNDESGSSPWVFYGLSYYVRSFLAGGPPSVDADPNIAIAYGTCTAF